MRRGVCPPRPFPGSYSAAIVREEERYAKLTVTKRLARPRNQGVPVTSPFPVAPAAPGAATPAGETPAGDTAMVIERDVPVPADDGTVLRADVFRPAGRGRYPVLLSYGPYAKGLAFQDGYADQWRLMTAQHPDVTRGSSSVHQNWETADPERWVPDGYACVRVDSRGAGRSPGMLEPFSPRETRDLHDCIEWAGRQPWSTGRVGLNGISYYAMNQWTVAGLAPPHLAAICVWEGAADFYRDATHHGGILCTFCASWYGKQVTVVQHGTGERGPRSQVTGEPVAGPETLSAAALAAARVDFGAQIRSRPLDGEFYRQRSADYAAITVPLLSAANWGGQGLHSRGNFEGFTQAASARKWLEVHGGEHWTHFYTDYGVDLQKRFFACFLHGDDSGWRDQPPVQLQVRTLDGFRPRAEQEWPLARTQWQRLYLRPGHRSLETGPPAADEHASYAADGDGLTFRTPPLAAEALQQSLLQRRQRGDIGFLPQPGDVGVAADGAGRGAGRVDQDAVEAFAALSPLPLGGVGHHGLGFQRQPRQIVAQPRHAARRTVDRGDARAGVRELRGLAARRGAEIGDGLAGDVAEQARRQRGGGVLHPPMAFGEARQHRHRALQQRAHRSRRQRFAVQARRPLLGIGLHGDIERRLVADRDRRCRARRPRRNGRSSAPAATAEHRASAT